MTTKRSSLRSAATLFARRRERPLSRPPPAPSGWGRRSVHAGQRDGSAEDVPTRPTEVVGDRSATDTNKKTNKETNKEKKRPVTTPVDYQANKIKR